MRVPERRRAPHAALSATCLVVAIACAGVVPRAAGGNAGSAQPAGGSGGGSAGGSGGRQARGSGGAPDAGGTSADGGSPIPPLTDFPPDPIIDTGAPPNAATLFSTSGRTSGAPCILSPEAGTLMPRNWLRPRFSYTPAADENLFEITLTVMGFAHQLVVYTPARAYTLDPVLWASLRTSVNDQPIDVTVRALTLSGSGTVQNPPSAAATADFTIAPVDAPGKIVYWAIPNGSSDGILRGFGIGEEGVEDVLVASQLVAPTITASQNDGCIGCHAATPDGQSVGFQLGPHNNSGPDSYYDSVADISGATVGQMPSWATPNQLAALRGLRGIPAFSRGHWTDGDHVVLVMDGKNQGQLLWLNLDTDGAQGTIARAGDSAGATEPSFSHDGTQIVYASATSLVDGRLANGPADLYTVTYGNRAGGAASKLAGASDPAYTEYYPSFSPDDAFVAFTRIAGNGNSYSNNQAEVFVVSSVGGEALRFGANDPPACQSGARSPGVTNDWPKWSPEQTTAPNGTAYYWMTFSSTRDGRPQLYVAPMTVKAGVVEVGYPALYLWNQPASDDNHTPSWDDYQIPSINIG
jgi:WD40-like Beta Propeller Repeat